jgi:DNA-binding response OmpR family regulator
MPQNRPVVLAVDDEHSILAWLHQSLHEFGYAVLPAGDVTTASKALYTTKIDAVILDVRLARESGLRLLESCRADTRYRDLPVLVLTGAQLTEDEEATIRAHRAYVFYKPEGTEVLVEALDRLLHRPPAVHPSI